MVPLVGILLAVLGLAPIQSQTPSTPPLNLTIYYEALCPDSARFVAQQLEPLWERIGAGDTLSLTFVPWGKAWEHSDEAGGTYVTCQHGPEECWGNRLHGCVLNELTDGGQQLAAVGCLLRNYRQLRAAAPSCVRATGLDWEAVSRCASSDSSLTEALSFGRRTAQLEPRLSFVPTMTVDGSQDGQQLMLVFLEHFVCETWRLRTNQTAAGCPVYG